MIRKSTILIVLLVVFALPVFSENISDEISWSQSGSSFYATAGVGNATPTVTDVLLIPDGANVASITIKSGTQGYSNGDTVSGSISNVTGVYINLSPMSTTEVDEDDTAPTLTYVIDRANDADTSVWMSIPTISNYGNYNVPVGSNRIMRIHLLRSGSLATKTSFIVRFDDG